MEKLVSTGVIGSVKIKPECGEVDQAGLEFKSDDYKTIARYIEDKEELYITFEAVDGSKIKIVSKGSIKECSIKTEGAKLKYDGLDFTTTQYKDLAYLVKEEVLTELSIEPCQMSLLEEVA